MSNLLELDVALQPISIEWLRRCNELFKTHITVTYRGAKAQNAAKAAGLSNAGAGASPHNCTTPEGLPASRAFDWAIFDDEGLYVKDGTDPRYAQSGQIGKDLGLYWGGDWTLEKDHCKPDYDHLQMQNWRTI